MQQIPFIGLFKSALHVSDDKLSHPQEHFLAEYTDFGSTLPPVGSNIGALYEKLYILSKTAPEDGRVCRPKHVELI
jgi:hypothetical protein